MSVSSISSGYNYYQTANTQQRSNQLNALDEALASGDLSAAQQAFSQLQQSAPSGPPPGNSADGVIADISALGQALASNDLSSAQSAFSTLQNDIQNAPPPPPPPAGIDGTSDTSNADEFAQAFSDLATALKNGDLEAAQSAFATLQSLAPDKQTAQTGTDASSSDASDQINNDFVSLGDALQNGDLDSAQSLFATLLTDLQSGLAQHPGLHHYQQDAATTSSVSVSA